MYTSPYFHVCRNFLDLLPVPELYYNVIIHYNGLEHVKEDVYFVK